jgi:transposase-like protein
MPKNVTSLPTTEVKPKPELERKTRRVFPVEFKLSILQQAEQCKHGELGALLRKHKLYSNQLAQWRREFAEQGVKGLSKSQPGPAAKKTAEQKRIEQLEKQVANLKKKVEFKDKCIDLQKKVLGMIEQIEQENQS